MSDPTSCPHCGAPAVPGNNFCNRCRKRIVPPSYTTAPPAAVPPRPSRPPAPVAPREDSPYRPPASSVPREDWSFPAGSPEPFKRPGVITVLAVLDLIGAAFGLLAAAAVAVTLASSNQRETGLIVVIVGLYGVVGVASLVAGIGLLKLRGYGRTIQIGLSCFGLLGFPLGTLISVLILVYLFKPGVKLLFSERDPADLSAAELAQVGAIASSGATVAIVLVCVLGSVCGVGIIAAIAIPSLLRARVSANEAAAIAQVRSVLAAERVYARSNAGLYDKVECLSAPATCVPGYGSGLPPLTEAAPPVSHGYQFTFHPGPSGVEQGSLASPSSVQRFAYSAAPVAVNRTGLRFFCADSSGRLCQTMDGPLVVEGAACPAACQPLP